MKYNIYAGLGGSFGGANYKGSIDCDSLAEAEDVAYQCACEEYESYEGLHGLVSYGDLTDENPQREDESNFDYDKRIEDIYLQEVENWLDYYAVLATEDTELDEDELFDM